MALAFAQLVGEVATEHRGSIVKLLGDGVLLHFPDPGDAVRASLDLVERAPAQGLPPTHIGVNAGPMLYDQGDYFGRTVNVASRIASHAPRVASTSVSRWSALAPRRASRSPRSEASSSKASPIR